jgi:hypothetical protein
MRITSLRTFRAAVVVTALGAVPLAAQRQPQATPEPMTVRTFMLQRLTQREAADLITPYVSGAEGVFTAGEGVRGVTVRGRRGTLVTVDSILRANDRPAGTIRLRFQLIAAVDSAGPVQPAIADVDAALRGLFSYKGYRFMGEGAVMVKEGFEGFNLTISINDMERYIVAGSVRQLELEAPTPTAQLQVSLRGPLQQGGSTLLFTQVPVSIGKTLVVGSSARIQASGTMILVVRPDRS